MKAKKMSINGQVINLDIDDKCPLDVLDVTSKYEFNHSNVKFYICSNDNGIIENDIVKVHNSIAKYIDNDALENGKDVVCHLGDILMVCNVGGDYVAKVLTDKVVTNKGELTAPGLIGADEVKAINNKYPTFTENDIDKATKTGIYPHCDISSNNNMPKGCNYLTLFVLRSTEPNNEGNYVIVQHAICKSGENEGNYYIRITSCKDDETIPTNDTLTQIKTNNGDNTVIDSDSVRELQNVLQVSKTITKDLIPNKLISLNNYNIDGISSNNALVSEDGLFVINKTLGSVSITGIKYFAATNAVIELKSHAKIKSVSLKYYKINTRYNNKIIIDNTTEIIVDTDEQTYDITSIHDNKVTLNIVGDGLSYFAITIDYELDSVKQENIRAKFNELLINNKLNKSLPVVNNEDNGVISSKDYIKLLASTFGYICKDVSDGRTSLPIDLDKDNMIHFSTKDTNKISDNEFEVSIKYSSTDIYKHNGYADATLEYNHKYTLTELGEAALGSIDGVFTHIEILDITAHVKVTEDGLDTEKIDIRVDTTDLKRTIIYA